MFEQFRAKILHWLRVPPEPSVPEGSPGSVLTFRAGRNYYRWLVLAWAASHVGLLAAAIPAWYFTSRAIARTPEWARMLYLAAEIGTVTAFAVALPLTFLALKWNYELRWYIVTDRSLRIRHGIWNVEELTLTFANIQEIRVTCGPVQKLLGIADVEVHAAGGGAGTSETGAHGHFARFQGVDNASTIRDLIVERLRTCRDLGLGGGGVRPEGPGVQRSTLAGLHDVLAEARALRSALEVADK